MLFVVTTQQPTTHAPQGFIALLFRRAMFSSPQDTRFRVGFAARPLFAFLVQPHSSDRK